MSTRANIKIIDIYKNELWFYRHSDGYPEGAMPLLKEFLELVKKGKIRDNISQASGWLIALGMEEYDQSLEKLRDSKEQGFDNWKVGSIEPTTGQHADIEYLYTIDLSKKTIKTEEV